MSGTHTRTRPPHVYRYTVARMLVFVGCLSVALGLCRVSFSGMLEYGAVPNCWGMIAIGMFATVGHLECRRYCNLSLIVFVTGILSCCAGTVTGLLRSLLGYDSSDGIWRLSELRDSMCGVLSRELTVPLVAALLILPAIRGAEWRVVMQVSVMVWIGFVMAVYGTALVTITLMLLLSYPLPP
jgi:hypothetical protein